MHADEGNTEATGSFNGEGGSELCYTIVGSKD